MARRPQIAHTIYASEQLPKSGNVYAPRVLHYLHDWAVDPSVFFAAAQSVRTPRGAARPDTIGAAQISSLFDRFDARDDGVLQAGAEQNALAAAAGVIRSYIGNSQSAE